MTYTQNTNTILGDVMTIRLMKRIGRLASTAIIVLLGTLPVSGCADPSTDSTISNKTSESILVELVLQKDKYGITSSEKAITFASDWLNEFVAGEGVSLRSIDAKRLSGTYEIAPSGFMIAHQSLGTKPYFTFAKLRVTQKEQTLSYVNDQTMARLFKPMAEKHRFEFKITDALFASATDKEDLIEADLQTVYATTKDSCHTSKESLITVLGRSVHGPGFDCELSDSRPAGTGLSLFVAQCKINDVAVSGDVVFDFGNYADHFEVSIPNNDDWLALYPCTQIIDLKQ